MGTLKLRCQIDRSYTWADRLAVLLIALSPILQHYKGLFMNGGVTVLLLALPYVLLKIAAKAKISVPAVSIILPMILFLLFKVIDHGTYIAEFGQVVFIILYAYVFCSSVIDPHLFIRIVTGISLVASFLIILQYICYYVLGFHLQLVPTSMLLDSSSQWVGLVRTGRIGITGRSISFYRPSAFFLEPSHMFLYLFAPMIYELLHPSQDKTIKRRAILLSIGIILSTSGMGVVVVAAVWILYYAKNGGKDERISVAKLLRPKNIIVLLCVIAVTVVLFFRVSFFHQILLRVVSKSGRESVISGRTALGNALIRRMNGKQLIFGISDRYSDIEFNMTGFNGTMYKYGIIGTVLSYVFFIKALIDLRQQHFWVAAVVVIISFFTAHTHGTFYMLFYVIFILDGYVIKYKHCQ